MTMYRPHRWVVIKLPERGYKVLGGWVGGYLDGDEWRLNSGITRADREDDLWFFSGASGSVYQCHESAYGVTALSGGILKKLVDRGAVEMPEDTDWSTLEYEV